MQKSRIILMCCVLFLFAFLVSRWATAKVRVSRLIQEDGELDRELRERQEEALRDLYPPDAVDVEPHRKRWAESWSKLQEYEIVIKYYCYCPDEILNPVRIRVREGEVQSAHYLYSGEAVKKGTEGFAVKVEDLFTMISEAKEQNVSSLQARFHPRKGYPTYISIDEDMDTFDDERTIEILVLNVTGSQQTAGADGEDAAAQP